MAFFIYNQTDTTATFNQGCSAFAGGVTNDARSCTVGGTMGSTEVGVDTGNETTASIFVYDCGAPEVATWESGSWIIQVNVTTQDAGTVLYALYVCDYNGSTFQTVVSESNINVGGIGVIERTIVRNSTYTPQSVTLSRPFIVAVFLNSDPHGGSSTGITPSGSIFTPIIEPAACDSKIATQYHTQFVNILW